MQVERGKEDWVSQCFIDPSNSERSQAMNLLAVGKIQGILLLLALDSEEINQFFEEIYNDTVNQLNSPSSPS